MARRVQERNMILHMLLSTHFSDTFRRCLHIGSFAQLRRNLTIRFARRVDR